MNDMFVIIGWIIGFNLFIATINNLTKIPYIPTLPGIIIIGITVGIIVKACIYLLKKD